MDFDETLLSRVEDASLNASAPPQQRWLDGWLLRTHPGKARRARCINALARGRLSVEQKLALAQAWFEEAGLPLLMRITRFSEPPGLDERLARMGWTVADETNVLVCTTLPSANATPQGTASDAVPPTGLHWQELRPEAFADTVGALRGSPPSHVAAHADRLRSSPVPYRGYALARDDGQALACGQFAREDHMVGIYDVHTHANARNKGLASWLCKRLLTLAASKGAATAYLQVEAENQAAQAVYRRLGFSDGYSYHYREPPPRG